MQLKWTGLGLVLGAFLIPWIWVAPIMGKHDPIAAFSQYLGIASLIAMSISQMLATRNRLIEPVFGGLDRVYVLHKWVGILAAVTMLLHDTIDAEMELGRPSALNNLGDTFGEVALYGLLILILITIITFIPYQLWLWTHRFMGAFFTAAFIHFFLIQKPFANGDPLGLYVSLFCILGIVAYVYTLRPASLRKRHRYTVSEIEAAGDAHTITMTPEGRPQKYQAGQFAFLSFDVPGLNETHPFTISKPPTADGTLRFTIKPLGDYTQNMHRLLVVGAKADVQLPFGRFTPDQSGKPQVWIAAGVGITPFLALSGAVGNAPVHAFVSCRHKAEIPHLAELEARASQSDTFKLTVIETARAPRLTAGQIADMVDHEIGEANIYFCGPKEMREALMAGFAELGVSKRRIHFEEFEIRSGIGFRRLIAALPAAKRYLPKALRVGS